MSSVWVQADVFERDLRHITTGQQADVTTAAYPSDRFNARVSRIASTVDPQTRTAKVRFLVVNPAERLKPGMFASITLFLAESGDALTIPAKAAFVEGIVLMRKGENPSAVLAAVKERVATLNASILPKPAQMVPFYDRTTLIDTTLHTVFKNLLEGAVLVAVVLWLFLGNARAAEIGRAHV